VLYQKQALDILSEMALDNPESTVLKAAAMWLKKN